MLSSRNIFLIDGLGAMLSALLTGVVLTYFNEYIGMPQEVLFPFAAVACLFTVYSLSCHFKTPANWRSFLVFIAISNTIYCLVSVGFVIYHFENLTTFGRAYFFLEIIVIGLLVFTELRLVLSDGE